MNTAHRMDPGFDAVAELVSARTGLVFPPDRRADLEARARKLMERYGIVDSQWLLRRLNADGRLLDDLIAEATVGETYFFREPGHFAFIRDEIVPEIRQRRGADHVLRAWSAGCASGEEPYSLAILFEEMGLASRARILATDISRAALMRAAKAVYGPWSLRGEGARLMARHLHRAGGHFHLAAHIRQRVEFAYLNLAEDVYPAIATGSRGMDVVLCRNVLIYLGPETVRAVARRLYDSLAVGGVLITGPSDPLLGEHAPFEVMMTSSGFTYRKPPPLDRIHPNRSSRATISAAEGGHPTATAPLSILPVPLPPPAAPLQAAAPDAEVELDPLEKAREALARGEWLRAAELTRPPHVDATVAAIHVRALASAGDSETAGAAAAEAAAGHPASVEVVFLHAVLLMNRGRYAEAELALKRVLYLDSGFAVAHLAHGATLHRLGRVAAAVRAYRNARDTAARLPQDEILPFSEGESASHLTKAATVRLAALESELEHGR